MPYLARHDPGENRRTQPTINFTSPTLFVVKNRQYVPNHKRIFESIVKQIGSCARHGIRD
jgi:hypothetical protein